ncbi:MAG: transposase, partial [Acidobacteria bacterium]|nr:transposase [Acidobacteriota bacterium]
KGKKELTFIGHLIQDYYFVDGQPLGEKNPKWLQDDYVKFIRWGQWRIERTGAGVLAFITNHGYLDNPTFRGMRQQLINAFTEIYVMDLHGNSKKKERSPDGLPDENVFDIQQGVTLGIFIKRPGKTGPAKVYHNDLWGARKFKQDRLFETDVHNTKWQELVPQPPLYLFIPQEMGLRAEYDRGWTVADALPRTLLGPNSHRDEFAVAYDSGAAVLRLKDLGNRLLPERAKPVECIYRPFDFRYMLYGPFAFDYHRPEINDNLLKPNVALISTRQTKEAFSVMATAKPAGQHKLATPYDGSYLSPLYLYPTAEDERYGQNHLGIETYYWRSGKDGRRPNFNPKFIADLEKRLGLRFVPECSAAVPAAMVEEAGEDAGATAELSIRNRGHLPHWERQGATYFVTFRLADSLPQATLESIEFERKDIVKTAEQQGRELAGSEQDRLDQLFSERVEQYLDAGAGSCFLAKAEIAEVVAGALQHFDGERYRLLAWCIMPNHVHVVFEPSPGNALADILHSWKSFTAKSANEILGRTGHFWQREYYDHLVRDSQDLGGVTRYVAQNPAKAGLKDWPWVWVPASQRDAGATTFGPEDVFNYIYAVLHSPTYRARYAEFLKSDFPRVPLTSDVSLFRSLCKFGGELVALHLLESPTLQNPIARYPVNGSNVIEKGFPKYVAPGEPEPGTGKPIEQGRAYISRSAAVPAANASKDAGATNGQYFEGVPPEVWNFHIGGYQVCEKWLKDRRGRHLPYDDQMHYCKVVTAIKETIRLMAEIDAAIPKWPIE